MNDRILILDDETSILGILEQYLTNEGYSCRATTSPFAALDLLKVELFSLLVVDLKMPEMHGIEVVRRAREIDPALAVIVITALVDVTSAIEALRAGADDYLLKPFNLDAISISVARALQKRNLILENRRYQHELEARVQEATKDLKRINQELRETKEYLENLINSTVDAIVTCDTHGKVEFVNQGACNMVGCFREELVGGPIARFLGGGADEARHIRRIVREDKPLQNYETELKHKTGRLIPVSVSISLVRGADGRISAMLLICKDITEQKRLQQELREMSVKDSLTGLYNQRCFYDRLESEIERARRQKHPLSLLLFDIDQFKVYNDTHGHLEGDKVLQAAAAVIRESTREHVDLGFRYGGDEFTVILPEAHEPQALNIAERIRTTFESRRFDGLTVSIGVMSYREGYSLRTFIQFADSMMYDAKRSGGNRVFTHKPETETRTGDEVA